MNILKKPRTLFGAFFLVHPAGDISAYATMAEPNRVFNPSLRL